MELKEFIDNFAQLFEDTDPSEFTAETEFKELEEWTSVAALSIMAMVLDNYQISLTANEIRKSNTIQELFDLVKSKQ
jgi:acyl carrier protein